ncbi:hypothetical protein Q3V30_12940 [Erwinia pyri]|uniref:Cell envelope biogenesis protein TolA n=1 Tax=Erwinia pyri TaxID=3062598 RepID=A0AA50HKU9_9GAMM|nr:hypothetical protein [Erwinia sp. DE2]WLS77391.1 hypothetical protein Q3V30_12940 [Erwinia sp. DE2]
MSETTDIAVLEIKPDQAPVVYVPNGLDQYIEQIKQAVNEVPDLTTAKGRSRVASLAAQVSRSKTAIEKPGREYLKRLKEAVKPAEAEIKRFVDACDALRDATRQPLTEWEAEQDRIAAEKAAEEEKQRIAAEELAAEEALKKQIESDHEIALLLNDKFDRDAAEAKAEAERQRIAHEEELKRQAVELARIEAEATAQRERDAAAKREADLKAAKEKAEADARAAQERAEREARETREKAGREKQQAIEAEQLKARQEADRIKREAEQKEAARLAEEKRIADEAAARAADIEHRKAVNNNALLCLVAAGLTEEAAKIAITAIAKGEVNAIRITY